MERVSYDHLIAFPQLYSRNKICDLVFTLGGNVWRYVQVAAESRWRVFLHSWCDAGLCGYYFILALAKTVTPAGAPGGAGAACAAVHKTVQFG